MFTYISSDLRGNNLVAVVSEIKVQVGIEVGRAPPNTTVSPHWKIFHKHFKEGVVVDSILKLFKLVLFKLHLAQKAPVDGIHKRYFVGRRLATVTNNGFSKTLSMTLGTDTLFAQNARVQVYILFCSSLLLFLFSRMLVTERE
jgi:hypothetical protein